MKKFIESILEWKTTAALLFSGTIILYTVIMLILGERTISAVTIASLIIICSVGTFLQLIAFSDHVIKNMRYTFRMIIFVIPFFVLLAANAYFLDWFPSGTVNWLTLTIIFLVVFIVMTIALEIYFRYTGKKYDGLLGQYRRQRELTNK